MDNHLQKFFSILGGRLGSVLVSVIATPILVRLLGSESYGDYAFMLSVLLLGITIINAGVFDGVRKFMVEERDHQQWKSHVFGFYLSQSTLLGVSGSVMIILLVYTGVVEYFLGNKFNTYFTILSIIILTKQLFYLLRGGLMGVGKESQSEPLYLVEKAGSAIIGILLAYASFGVVGVLVGYLIATLIAATCATYFLFKSIDFSTAVFGGSQAIPHKELTRYNAYTVVLTVLFMSLFHIDVLLLRVFLDGQQTAYYKGALMIAEFTLLVPTALQILLIHSTSKMWERNKTEQITELASMVTRYNLLFLALIIIGLAVLADPFMPLYFGSEFTAAITPLLILLPGVLGFALARPIIAIGQGKGDLRILIASTGCATVANLVLNLLLIPQYGMVGAAVATSLSYGSLIFLHIWSASMIGFNPISNIPILRISFTSAISAPLIYIVARWIPNDILTLILIPPIGLFVYIYISIKVGTISEEEIKQIVNNNLQK